MSKFLINKLLTLVIIFLVLGCICFFYHSKHEDISYKLQKSNSLISKILGNGSCEVPDISIVYSNNGDKFELQDITSDKKVILLHLSNQFCQTCNIAKLQTVKHYCKKYNYELKTLVTQVKHYKILKAIYGLDCYMIRNSDTDVISGIFCKKSIEPTIGIVNNNNIIGGIMGLYDCDAYMLKLYFKAL